MRLYFVRHGESTANLLREFSNSGFKHPLTEKGVEQARAVARALSGLQVEQIYSSPVMRAVQTAQILAESLQAPLEVTEALREWNVGIYVCYRPSSETWTLLSPVNMASRILPMPWLRLGLTGCVAALGAGYR